MGNLTLQHRGLQLAFLMFFSISTFLGQEKSLPENFDQWIESGRTEWDIPGMAVGIVKNGEVIYAKGFGEKRLGEGDKVDANTIFSIASVSKNMTAAALGILVDENKISWDDKITQHIPWFQMKDPWITNEMTIRDVLTHQVGLGRILGNRLQFMTLSERDSILYTVRHMDLESSFRSKFVYNNVMYSLAGQIIEYTDGKTWDDFLKERLFQPLEMNNTTTSITQIKNTDNQAHPHQEIDGKVIPIQRRNWDNAGPAGGVNSTVNDLNKWLIMQLQIAGSFKDKTIISPKQMTEIQKPQVLRSHATALSSHASYGLGWNILDYKNHRVITHGGATDGFITAMYLVPELELGVVVLTNTFNNFADAVSYQVMDAFIDKNDKDWNQVYRNNYNRAYERATKARNAIHDARVKNTKTSLSLDAYTGTYYSKAYGKVEVKRDGNQLKIQFWNTKDLEAQLEHWHFDTFRAVWNNRAQREEFMQFHLGKDGKIEALDFEFVLRPMLLQVGAYPSNYTHTERFLKQ